jgi:hypothetical protein
MSVFVNEWKCARKKQASALIVLSFVAIGVMSGQLICSTEYILATDWD